MGGEYTRAATDQRHRAVFNGIWEAPYGLQLSGVYFYGSGLRFSTSVGGDPRGQAAGGENRYRTTNTAAGPAGTIAPRNKPVGSPDHRRRIGPRGQAAAGENRYRTTNTAVGPAGTIAPRNNLVGSPIHRLDMRLQKHVNL